MAKRIITSAFIFGLFSMSNQLALKQQTNCNKPPVKRSIIKFNIDDVVTHFAINGNDLLLNMSDDEKGNWMYTHTVEADLYPGDIVSLSGYDKQGGQGILGTIQYYNAEGTLTLIHTGDKWLCGDQKPNVQSKNNGKIWPYVPCVDSNANWIWNASPTAPNKEVTCSYKLPNGY